MDSYTAAESFRAAGDRFHAHLAEASTAHDRDHLAAEWDAYERRHGTPHPGRTADRIQRQATEQVQRAPRFHVLSVGERGQAERGRAPVHAQQTGPGWDDNDPDMMEPPAMVDLGNWRSGRKW